MVGCVGGEATSGAFRSLAVRGTRLSDRLRRSGVRAAQGRAERHQCTGRAVRRPLRDAQGLGDAPAKLRKDISVWTKSHEAYLTRVQIANVLVIPSAIIRMGVQAIQWFAPPPCPTVVVDSVAEGEPFLRDHLTRAQTP